MWKIIIVNSKPVENDIYGYAKFLIKNISEHANTQTLKKIVWNMINVGK